MLPLPPHSFTSLIYETICTLLLFGTVHWLVNLLVFGRNGASHLEPMSFNTRIDIYMHMGPFTYILVLKTETLVGGFLVGAVI